MNQLPEQLRNDNFEYINDIELGKSTANVRYNNITGGQTIVSDCSSNIKQVMFQQQAETKTVSSSIRPETSYGSSK